MMKVIAFNASPRRHFKEIYERGKGLAVKN